MNYANEPQLGEQLESVEDVSAKTLNELIRKYESIVYDYLAIMNSSETLKSMDIAKYAVQLGLNAITHIYKLAFLYDEECGDFCRPLSEGNLLFHRIH